MMEASRMKFAPLPAGVTEPCAQAGTMTRFCYTSETYDDAHWTIEKDALVYLPYGYDKEPERRYPVLFLMHGGGGNADEFFGGIEAKTALKNILDQSIASGYAQPMIVVAPSYLVPGMEEARHQIGIAQQLTHRFPTELKNDLIPAITACFRTVEDRSARAFGGFSMGGETTWSVMANCLPQIRTLLPLSGDYWAIALKGGKDYPQETVEALISQIAQSGVRPEDFRVLAFTGDHDIAYEALEPMVRAMAARADWFTYADSPVDGNLCYCLKENGWHTYDDCYEYIYLALPWLFC